MIKQADNFRTRTFIVTHGLDANKKTSDEFTVNQVCGTLAAKTNEVIFGTGKNAQDLFDNYNCVVTKPVCTAKVTDVTNGDVLTQYEA